MSTQKHTSDKVWDKFNQQLKSEYEAKDLLNPLHISPEEMIQSIEKSLLKEDSKRISSEKHVCNEFNKNFDEEKNPL
jgi:hypothetical protein